MTGIKVSIMKLPLLQSFTSRSILYSIKYTTGNRIFQFICLDQVTKRCIVMMRKRSSLAFIINFSVIREVIVITLIFRDVYPLHL